MQVLKMQSNCVVECCFLCNLVNLNILAMINKAIKITNHDKIQSFLREFKWEFLLTEWAPQRSLITNFCALELIWTWCSFETFFWAPAIIMSSFDPTLIRDQSLIWEPALKRGYTVNYNHLALFILSDYIVCTTLAKCFTVCYAHSSDSSNIVALPFCPMVIQRQLCIFHRLPCTIKSFLVRFCYPVFAICILVLFSVTFQNNGKEDEFFCRNLWYTEKLISQFVASSG